MGTDERRDIKIHILVWLADLVTSLMIPLKYCKVTIYRSDFCINNQMKDRLIRELHVYSLQITQINIFHQNQLSLLLFGPHHFFQYQYLIMYSYTKQGITEPYHIIPSNAMTDNLRSICKS